MVVMDLEEIKLKGKLNPSSDTKTHLYNAIVFLYRRYCAYPFSMGYKLGTGRRDIPCYGTTHADYIYGAVPCARNLTKEELKDYEKNTGVLIFRSI